MKAAAVLWAALPAMTLLHAQDQGTIQGRVTNSVTGEGVGGVTVRFLDRQSYVHQTATDSSGSYRISGLKDNDYRAEFTKEGFADGSPAEYIHVAAAAPAEVNAALTPFGSLRGRILDETGNPAQGVPVEIDSRAGNTITDARGEFEFSSLPAGSYTLAVKPDPKIRVQDGERLGSVTMYYPSATEQGLAVPITVHNGETVSGIEMRLRSVPVHRLAGIVVDESGSPAAHAIVQLLDRSGGGRKALMFSPSMGRDGGVTFTVSAANPRAIEEAVARDDGTFEFPAVQAGEWRLSATLNADGDAPLAGVASASVSGKDVEEVRIRLAGPFAAGFSADWGDATPPKFAGRASNLVQLIPVESQPRLNLDPEQNVTEIHGLFPGRYRVIPLFLPPDLYPAAVMWGGRNVAGEAVDLVPDAEPLRIIYKSGLGSVRGVAEHGAGATVLAYPRDAGETARAYTADCAADGSFVMLNLAPGDYDIAAFPHQSSTSIPWNALPAALAPIAAAVHVDGRATAVVNLQVNPWP